MSKMRKVNRINLERKDDNLLYHLGEEEPFTGQYTFYHDNGERAEQAQVKNGQLHGGLSIWNEEGIMAAICLNFTETYILAGSFERLDQFLGLIGRVEPIRGEGDDKEFAAAPAQILEAFFRVDIIDKVKVISGLGDVKKRVGVKTLDKFGPLITEITLHLKIHPEIIGKIFFVLEIPSEFTTHGLI